MHAMAIRQVQHENGENNKGAEDNQSQSCFAIGDHTYYVGIYSGQLNSCRQWKLETTDACAMTTPVMEAYGNGTIGYCPY
jgi:hypothetical protein